MVFDIMAFDSMVTKDILYASLGTLVGLSVFFSIKDVQTRILFVGCVIITVYLWNDRKLSERAEISPSDQMKAFAEGFEKDRVVWPKTFDVIQTRDGSNIRFLYLHPEVVRVLYPLRGFVKFKRGTLEEIVTYLEQFYELFYACLADKSMNIAHDAQTLLDLRDAGLNSVQNLAFAFPTRAWQKYIQRATRTVQASTYRCLKTLHNKYGASVFKHDYFYWSPKPSDASKSKHYDVF